MSYNRSLQLTAKPLRGLVPSALRAPAATELRRYALLSLTGKYQSGSSNEDIYWQIFGYCFGALIYMLRPATISALALAIVSTPAICSTESRAIEAAYCKKIERYAEHIANARWKGASLADEMDYLNDMALDLSSYKLYRFWLKLIYDADRPKSKDAAERNEKFLVNEVSSSCYSMDLYKLDDVPDYR